MDSTLFQDSIVLTRPRASASLPISATVVSCPCLLFFRPDPRLHSLLAISSSPRRPSVVSANGTLMTDSVPPRDGVYTVGDFMTKKEDLLVVKPITTVDEALETLVEHRITGLPVIDDDWKLVGLVSDFDLLALDSISGGGRTDNSMFPEVDSAWKIRISLSSTWTWDNALEFYISLCIIPWQNPPEPAFESALHSLFGLLTFNEVQKLLSKTNGKLVGDLMTPAPVVVRETTNLEDAARLLLETKYRRLPVVDAEGKLVGIITRGNVVRAALQINRALESLNL